MLMILTVEATRTYKSIKRFGWLVREEILLAGLCERKILFRLKIYDRLRKPQPNKHAESFLGTWIWSFGLMELPHMMLYTSMECRALT